MAAGDNYFNCDGMTLEQVLRALIVEDANGDPMLNTTLTP